MSYILKGTITNPDKIYGKSAYEIAVMHGFDGTEEEWVKATDLAKEITLDSATKAQYYAGLADSAQENAQKHETDARNWEREAFAHLQEVRNVVDVAGEKLDLLANIPDDYITLDADVKSNAVEIIRNKEDIASNERAIAKNAENITRNTKRITNIEQGLVPDSFETDDSVAYQKDVPANALPYAAVNKIGGMTRKCANLIHYPYFETTKTANGITFTDSGDGTIIINGTATENISFTFGRFQVVSGQTCFYKVVPISGGYDSFYAYIYTDSNDEAVDFGSGVQFTPNGNEASAVMVIVKGQAFSNLIVKPMLNEGSTAQPYEPFFEGLRSAKVTEVKSVGVNLFNLTYEMLGDSYVNGVNGIVINNSNSITGKAEIRDGQSYIVHCQKFPSGVYTCRQSADGVVARIIIRLYNASNEIVSGAFTIEGMRYNDFYKGFFADVNELTINVPADVAYWRIGIYFGEVGATATISNIQVSKGAGVPYTPYVEHTLPIPEAVRPANGINENVYDYIEWAEGGSVKKTVKCGMVDLGALSWGYGNYFGTDTMCFYSTDIHGAKLYNAYVAPTAICYLYDPTTANEIAQKGARGFALFADSGSLIICDTNYTDAATFKAAMSDVMLVYELAEPIVTDISDLITADNLIGVEGGGTLTFENEHKYAVPSEVEYQVEV